MLICGIWHEHVGVVLDPEEAGIEGLSGGGRAGTEEPAKGLESDAGPRNDGSWKGEGVELEEEEGELTTTGGCLETAASFFKLRTLLLITECRPEKMKYQKDSKSSSSPSAFRICWKVSQRYCTSLKPKRSLMRYDARSYVVWRTVAGSLLKEARQDLGSSSISSASRKKAQRGKFKSLEQETGSPKSSLIKLSSALASLEQGSHNRNAFGRVKLVKGKPKQGTPATILGREE
jgi:hypothetical protein